MISAVTVEIWDSGMACKKESNQLLGSQGGFHRRVVAKRSLENICPGKRGSSMFKAEVTK